MIGRRGDLFSGLCYNMKAMSEVVATIRIQRFLKNFRLENGIRTVLYSEAYEKIKSSDVNTGYFRAIS